MESGKLLLEEADFDLNRELEGLVDMFSVQCVDHDIEIVLDLAGTSNEPWSKNAKNVKFFPPLSYLQMGTFDLINCTKPAGSNPVTLVSMLF